MRRTIKATIIFLSLLIATPRTIYGDTGDKRQQANELHSAGERSYSERRLADAMSHYLDGLRISEKNGFNEESCKIYIGIGNLYSSQADYEMGIIFYLKALDIAKKENNRTLQNKVLNNLVGASCFAGKPNEGKRYYELLAKNKENTAEYHYNLLMCQGLIATNEGEPRIAIDCYRQAIAYAAANHLDGGHKEAAQACLSQLYYDTNKPDSALHYLRLNERTARAKRQNDLLIETLRNIASIYEQNGDAQRALECKEEYVELTDSLYNKDEFFNMKNAQFLYETHKSETAINSLTEEKRQQRLWLLTLSIGAAAFAALLVMVYSQKRQLRRAYNELFDRNQAMFVEKEQKPASTASNLLTDEQHTKLLKDIRLVMEETDEFCHADFNIDKLASLIGSNSRYVSAVINEDYGKNFRTFLNEYRIKEAMRRLTDTENYGNYTIKAVSEGVGYKSQANFISVFTKVTGMKPSIFQKISQGRKQATD